MWSDKKSRFFLFLVIGLTLASAAGPGLLSTAPAIAQTPPAGAPSADALLKASDVARGGNTVLSLEWTVELASKEGGKSRSSSYLIKMKNHNVLAETLTPAKDKGGLILINERTLWYFKPGLRKPVSISARQRLMGEAANGDIAATNYATDYTGTIVGEEKLNGVDTWKLDLKARASNVTYDRIRYWIAKESQLGIKAEFLTLQGEVFKIATFNYDNTITQQDRKIPFISKMTITSATYPDDVTTMTYGAPAVKELPDSIFNINSLVR